MKDRNSCVAQPDTLPPLAVVTNPRNARIETTSAGDVAVVDIGGPIVFLEDREIWERQPEEPDIPWNAFKIYRSLLPIERSIRETHRRVTIKEGSVNVSFNLYAKQYRWIERAAEHDRYMDIKEEAALLRQRIASRKATAALGRHLRSKALEALENLEVLIHTTRKNPETGQMEPVVKSALTPNEIVRLAEVGVKLERLALNLREESEESGTQVKVDVRLQTGSARNDEYVLKQAQTVIETREHQRTVLAAIQQKITHHGPLLLADMEDSGGVQTSERG